MDENNEYSEMGLDKVGGNSLLGAIPTCSQKCPIYAICKYDRRNKLCGMRKDYFEMVGDGLNEILKDNPTTAHIVSCLLMPMYQHLLTVKLSIHAHSGVLDTNTKGTINPVYKELRETIKMITGMLKDLGILGGQQQGGQAASKTGDIVNGTGDWYDKMVSK